MKNLLKKTLTMGLAAILTVSMCFMPVMAEGIENLPDNEVEDAGNEEETKTSDEKMTEEEDKKEPEEQIKDNLDEETEDQNKEESDGQSEELSDEESDEHSEEQEKEESDDKAENQYEVKSEEESANLIENKFGEALDEEEFDGTISISGTVTWDEISEQIPDDADTVLFAGNGEDAVIEFTDKVILSYETTFDNICLKAKNNSDGGQKTAVELFACGHKFRTTDTVTTDGFVSVYGGGYECAVADTDINLEGGSFFVVAGGGYSDEAGDDGKASAEDCNVYIGTNASAAGVIGGCQGGVTTGNISITYKGNNAENIFIAGSSVNSTNTNTARVSNPDGKITIMITEGAIAGEVYGALYSVVDADTIDIINYGTVNNIYGSYGSSLIDNYNAYGIYPGKDYYHSESADEQEKYPVIATVNIVSEGTVNQSIYGGAGFVDIDGVVNITDNGCTDNIYGGMKFADMKGINVTVNGTVNNIYGGEILTAGLTPGKLTADITITLGEEGKAGTIFGGGRDWDIVGNISENIYGEVTGNVFGGGQITCDEGFGNTNVSGLATVYIHQGAKVDGSVFGGSWNGTTYGGTRVYVYGTVSGDVYGGGWTRAKRKYNATGLIGASGSTYVELGGNATATNVFGGGQMANVKGNSEVVLKESASVQNLCGAGNPYTEFDDDGTRYSFYSATENIEGDVLVTIQDNAKVKNVIYGYKTILGDEDFDYTAGSDTVVFTGCTGSFKRVRNADLVKVTEQSDITIDYEEIDYAQLVHIADLTIDNGGKLTLLSDAEVSGTFSGNTGTLVIAAKQTLTANTISGLNQISIWDYEGNVPAAGQVYIISKAGTTEDNGSFSWMDQRSGFLMAWKANTNGTAQWYLVKGNKLTYWVPDSPTIDTNGSIVSNGWKSYEVKTYLPGTKISLDELMDYSYENFSSLGWYLDPYYLVKVNTPIVMLTDINLYANLQSNTVNLTYCAQDSSGNWINVKTVPYTKGQIVKTDELMTAEDLKNDMPDIGQLTGWYTNTDFKLIHKVRTPIVMIKDTTLYAQTIAETIGGVLYGAVTSDDDLEASSVSAETKTVTYWVSADDLEMDNSVEEDGNDWLVEDTEQYDVGTVINSEELLSLNFAGYNFNGWYTDANLENAVDESITITEDMDLYAALNKESTSTSSPSRTLLAQTESKEKGNTSSTDTSNTDTTDEDTTSVKSNVLYALADTGDYSPILFWLGMSCICLVFIAGNGFMHRSKRKHKISKS